MRRSTGQGFAPSLHRAPDLRLRGDAKQSGGNGPATLRVQACELARPAARLRSVKILTAAGPLAAVLVLAACASASPAAEPSGAPPSDPPAASSPSSPAAAASSPSSPAAASAPAAAAAATTAPALTGFGATLAQWNAAHQLDTSVPAGGAYLPRVPGDPDGSDTWQVVTVAGGRVISYTLNLVPSSLRAAEARAAQELPADARVL
jgi:hypothetical protein